MYDNDSPMSSTPLQFGSRDLRLPDDLREPLLEHLEHLKTQYLNRQWGGRVGFGKRPAVIVIDLALWWTDPDNNDSQGSDVDSVVESTCQLLEQARAAGVPIFFTTWDYNQDYPPSPHDRKLVIDLKPGDEKKFELDPRVNRKENERIIAKRYASSFKGTNLHKNLAALGIDTLIVTGVSTSHCVYATCRDATDSFRVIVPRQAVGERCEIMHLVNLLDIDIDLGDVVDLDEVITYIKGLAHEKDA